MRKPGRVWLALGLQKHSNHPKKAGAIHRPCSPACLVHNNNTRRFCQAALWSRFAVSLCQGWSSLVKYG